MADEKRLIDAQKAYEMGHRTPFHIGIADLCDLKELLADVPTVDAVEVVRCKDCMWARPKDHREPTSTPREIVCQCLKHHHIPAPWGARLAVNPDDFCSYGERRSDEVSEVQK